MNKKVAAVFLLLVVVMVLSSCTRITALTSTVQYKNTKQEKDVLEADGISFTVTFGYDKFVKSGRYAQAVIHVLSEEDFSGTVQAEFISQQAMDIIDYAQEFNVTANEDKKIEMAIPIKNGNDEIRFSIKDTKDKEVLHKREKVNISYNEGIYYVGVLTDKKDEFPSYNLKDIKIFPMSKEDFPENVLCLDIFDTIILYDFDAASLNEIQQQTLDQFSKKAGIQITNELPANENAFSKQVLNNITTEKKIQVEREKYGSNTSYSAFASTAIKSDDSIPKVGNYAIVIILYLFLSGPPLYLLLKKINKPGAMWLAVPLLSIGFAVIIFGISSKTRLREPYAGYFSVSNIREGALEKETYFTLTSPSNISYSVDIPEAFEVSAVDMYNNNLNFSKAFGERIEITKKSEETELSISNNASFDKKYFYAVKTEEQGMKLDSTLSQGKDFKIKGSISNTSSYDINNALLCVGDTYTILGNIKQGETKELDDLESFYMVSSVNLYSDKILERISGDKPMAGERDEHAVRISSAYQYFLETRMSSFHKEDVVLAGFVEDKTNAELFGETIVKSDGIEMVAIESQANYSDGEETFIPNLDIYLKTDNLYYYDTYRNMGGQTMKLQICFEPEDTIKSLIYSKELNTEFYEKNWVGFYGNIKAYNQETRQYDVIFESGKEDELTNVDSYLDNNNTMSILVESDVKMAKDKSITLPVLSAVKESK